MLGLVNRLNNSNRGSPGELRQPAFRPIPNFNPLNSIKPIETLSRYAQQDDSAMPQNFAAQLGYGFIKNFAKACNSILADLFSNSLSTDSFKIPWNKVVYDTFANNILLRTTVDTTVDYFIRAAKAIPIVKHIPEDVLSIAVAQPLVFLAGNVMSRRDLQAQVVGLHDRTEQEKHIIDVVEKQPVSKIYNFLSVGLADKVKKPIDKFLDVVMGIKAPKKLKDKNGNILKDKDGNDLENLPEINHLKFASTLGMILGSTFLLPKKEKPTGFGNVNSVGLMLRSQILHICGRINSGLLRGINLQKKGKNFSYIYSNAANRKLIIPTFQYLSDGLAPLLPFSKQIGSVPVSLGMRFFFETFASFFTLGAFKVSKQGDRVPDDYRFIALKYMRPATQFVEDFMRPAFAFLAKNVYGKTIGLYKDVPGMYDILPPRTIEKEMKNNPRLSKYKDTTHIEALGIMLKSVLMSPYHAFLAMKDNMKKNDIYQDYLNAQVDKANREIDLQQRENPSSIKSNNINLSQISVTENMYKSNEEFSLHLKPELAKKYYESLTSNG